MVIEQKVKYVFKQIHFSVSSDKTKRSTYIKYPCRCITERPEITKVNFVVKKKIDNT